ncbi:MAG: hypothetical protein HY303_06220 [Candidatus Wallbacteria bacterium]|nr:hypothetical protein [Candidatus Wallbacteria bacterium]
MRSLVSMVLVTGTVLALMSSGADLALSVRDVARMSLQRLEMQEIEHQILNRYQDTVSFPTAKEFPDFLRQRMRTPGRDAAHDLWDTPYWLETARYESRLLNFPALKGEFVLISAGPDKVWLSQDDLVVTHLSVTTMADSVTLSEDATRRGTPGTVWPVSSR